MCQTTTDPPVAGVSSRHTAGFVATASFPQDRRATLKTPERRRAQRLPHRDLDGMELVVARHLLDQHTAAVVFDDQEVAHEGQEAALLKHAFDRDLQGGLRGGCQFLAADRPPRLEPLPPGRKRAQSRLDAVRHGPRRH